MASLVAKGLGCLGHIGLDVSGFKHFDDLNGMSLMSLCCLMESLEIR